MHTANSTCAATAATPSAAWRNATGYASQTWTVDSRYAVRLDEAFTMEPNHVNVVIRLSEALS
jgi:hypothetical protein